MGREHSEKGKVEVHHCTHFQAKTNENGEEPFDARLWPNGQHFVDLFSDEEFDIHLRQTGDSYFWQTAVRWCLLKKFNACPSCLQDFNPYQSFDGPYQTLSFSSEESQAINEAWQKECDLARKNNLDASPSLCSDLGEFLSTGKSNGRSLQWSILDCGPGCQFKLHSHPNLEIAYCVQGCLHEIRMDGSPLTREFESCSSDDSSSGTILKGPNLSSLTRAWRFGTIVEGEWLVNELGSIHKSFTATNGEGCLLLAFWGGSHADIPVNQEPTSVNVHEAVATMDRTLGDCTCRTKWSTIRETFLPESERSQA